MRPLQRTWWDKTQFQVGPDGKPLTQTQLFAGIGNASKNNPVTRRPWFLKENLTVSKDINFFERVRFTLRFEAFNVVNRVRWGDAESTFTSANFGSVRSQGNNPRRMQFGAKVTF